MAMLRLIHSPDSAEDLLFRGNAELASGRPDQALQLYTKVLYDVCPGHVCAFLNRALAYINLGYPELAVMDTYRAATVCNKLRYSSCLTPQMDSVCRAVEKYLRADNLHYTTGELWTTPPQCNIGPGWLNTELSRIVFAPELGYKSKHGIPWDALEIRALFRMTGALWHCGLGARSDALGIVEDIFMASDKRIYQLKDREILNFRALGNEILEDCVRDLSSDNELTKDLMRTKTTLVHRVIYPWDTHVPDLRTFKDVEQLESYADSAAKSCTVRSAKATSESGFALKLIAARDISRDEIVLEEESLLQVKTADPISTDGFFCDSCAAAMITSEKAQPNISKQKQYDWPSSGASYATTERYSSSIRADDVETEENTSNTLQFLEGTHDYGSIEDLDFMEDTPDISQATENDVPNAPRSSPPPLPPQHSTLDMTPDFHLCNVCQAATFCCGDCLGFSSDYHITLCNTGLEAYIRASYNKQAVQKSSKDSCSLDGRWYIQPKARCIYDLLFVRIFSMAADQDMNALDLPTIRWLNGDLRSAPGLTNATAESAETDPVLYPDAPSEPAPGQQTKTFPWSFTNNVLNPFHYLKTMGIDPIAHLDKTDGWILNTLFAKIMHSTRITKGARHAKVYDDIGKLIAEQAPAPQPVDEEVWVGTIHPIFSMISVADAEKGEEPNVTVREGKDVECFAKGQDAVCIQAGEYIMRAL